MAWATENLLGIRAEGKGTVHVSFTATGDLSDEQVRYAAADAVETMWVGDVRRERLRAVGLERVAELDEIARQRRATLGRLAELTGGGRAACSTMWSNPPGIPGPTVRCVLR